MSIGYYETSYTHVDGDTLRSAGLRDSVHWMSWFTAFSILAIVNALLGGIVAKALPNSHVFNTVNYASVFGSLLFLNTALTTASFFLAAICGTCISTALSVFMVMVIIIVSSIPTIISSVGASSVSIYGYSYYGGSGAGAFWAYTSTEQTNVYYNSDYVYNETTGEYEYIQSDEPTNYTCQSPIISYEESRIYDFPEERLERYSKEDFFQGCYIKAGASTQFSAVAWKSFLWFFIPQAHFMTAWSNSLGYTSLPGNTFGFAQSGKSPEVLAQEALLNYRGGEKPLFDEANTNGTSLFVQGSTLITETYYVWDNCQYVEDPDDPWGGGSYVCRSNCPPEELSSPQCGSNTCPNPSKGYPLPPSGGSPSLNNAIGYLFAVTLVYSILAAYLSSVLPGGNGSPMKFYFPLLPSYWFGSCKKRPNGTDGAAVDEEEGAAVAGGSNVGVEAVGVSKRYGKLEALKPLNLTMSKGEVTGKLPLSFDICIKGILPSLFLH